MKLNIRFFNVGWHLLPLIVWTLQAPGVVGQFEVDALRGQGCDGIDNDFDDVVDECTEDQVAPSLKLPFVPDIPFRDVDAALAFLEEYLCMEDDCAAVLVKELVEEPTCVGKVDGDSVGQICTFNYRVYDPRCNMTMAEFQTFESFSLTVAPPLPIPVRKFQGCDGIDNNYNCEIDECNEDKVPPTITLDSCCIPEKAFQSVEEAEQFLLEKVEITDDCAFNFTEPEVMLVECEGTHCTFSVTVSDANCLPPMDPVAPDTPGMPTGSAEFVLEVIDPANSISVTCGFFASDGCSLYPEGEIVVIGDDYYGGGLVDVKFWYQIGVPEGVDLEKLGKLDVCVNVLSNELEVVDGVSPMAFLAKSREGPESVVRTDVLLAPSSCRHKNYPGYPGCADYGDSSKGHKSKNQEAKTKSKKFSKKGEEGSFYQYDFYADYQHMGASVCLPEKKSAVTTRFYDIEVVVSDEACNEFRATCTVAVAPEGYKEDYKYGHDYNWRHLKELEDHVKSAGGISGPDGGTVPGEGSGAGQEAAFTSFGGNTYRPPPYQNPAHSLLSQYKQSKKNRCVATLCTEWDPTLDSALPTPECNFHHTGYEFHEANQVDGSAP
mmetsp:Transcript_27601/g.51785  ORF Transcript_27601/g.51785 Transcript_27601/m.51785 type:complete len:604 (+) Transcript_27601:137-1948(+)